MPSRMELLVKNRKFQICSAIVIGIIMLGVIGPFVTRSPSEQSDYIYEAPSFNFLLGTDMAGRDIFAQLCVAIRDSFWVGIIAGLSSLIIAILIGGVLSYKKGLVDEGANLVTNIFMVLPQLVILIIIAALLEGRRSLEIVGILIGLFSWPWMARSLRSQILSLRERKFVDLARISGKSDLSIVVKEILPNMLAYVFLVLIIAVSGAVVAEAGISVLGLGPSTGFTLGKMLQLAISWNATSSGIWWYFGPPGFILTVLTGTLVMITAFIDDVLNPKVRTE